MAETKPFTYRSQAATEYLERWYEATLARWPVPYREHRIATSYGSTYVIECGQESGEPLLLLHGIGMNSGTWRVACDIPALAERSRLLFVDIIGDHGRSLIDAKPKNGLFYADWLTEVCGGLGVEAPILAGASFGAAIALFTAFKQPTLPRQVIAMVPSAVVTKVRLAPLLRMLTIGVFFKKSKMIKFLEYVNGGPLSVAQAQESLDLMCYFFETKSYPVVAPVPVLKDDELRSIEVPCRCFMAEKDPFYDARRVTERVNALQCKIEVEVVPNLGHLLGQDFTPFILAGLEA